MAQVFPEPILATWKISDVLKRYPQLLDVLVGLSPEFERLRNPILRQVQTRLVSVGQAAKIAGLDQAEVVRKLNAAAGLTAPAEPREAETKDEAAPPWVGAVPVAVELDVRAYHERGEEPFGAIMAGIAGVEVGQVFRLRNTFEPLPLYDVLGRRGFLSWSRKLGDNDWEIFFFRTPSSAPVGPAEGLTPPCHCPPAGMAEQPAKIVKIDVSDLVPPEPMIRILEALEEIHPGEAVLVHHQRRPVYLYPRLDELGYVHETRELGPNQIEILIRKPER